MTKAKEFIQRHSLPIYFILAFAVSWGAILMMVGPNGIPVNADQAVTLGMAMLLGPSSAGLVLTGLAFGMTGFRELLSRLLRWKVSARWYVVALLTAPLSTVAVLQVLSLYSPEFTSSILISNDKATLILMGIIAGLMVGFFEELGWTGFAIPQMRPRYGILSSGIIVGILWGAWHFLLFWESDSFSARVSLALLLVRLFSWLPAYRVLMVWVHDQTKSLLIVMLMHVSLVATLTIIDPALTGVSLLIFILIRAATLWLIVAAVAVAQRGQIEKSKRAEIAA